MKKGLRPPDRQRIEPYMGFKTCPDEEGIKTFRVLSGAYHFSIFKTCPDEEGIKTTAKRLASTWPLYSKLALMKKGLRPPGQVGQLGHPDIQNLP